MKISLLGKKIGMTQVFDDNNRLIPVTVVEAGPCPVLQVKTTESDGYNAIQIGFGAQKPQRVSKAMRGHFEKAGAGCFREVAEVRLDAQPEQKVSDVLTVELFSTGQKIDVIGQSKGFGFQGVIKRWGFSGGPAAHGSMFHRRGGSFGCREWPGEIQKGKKMPGHKGDKRRTVQNLEIIKIIPEKNLILIKGSLPGANGNTVVIRTAKKTKGTK